MARRRAWTWTLIEDEEDQAIEERRGDEGRGRGSWSGEGRFFFCVCCADRFVLELDPVKVLGLQVPADSERHSEKQ